MSIWTQKYSDSGKKNHKLLENNALKDVLCIKAIHSPKQNKKKREREEEDEWIGKTMQTTKACIQLPNSELRPYDKAKSGRRQFAELL